jgi:hypothetical protein
MLSSSFFLAVAIVCSLASALLVSPFPPLALFLLRAVRVYLSVGGGWGGGGGKGKER